MQRLVKILGIFCRLALRDGKRGYLGDLPMVMAHIEELHQEHSEVFSDGWLVFWGAKLSPALRAFLAT